jgi:hypothetical protein
MHLNGSVIITGMTYKRRVQITLLNERTVTLRRHKASVMGWCSRCAAEVMMLRPEEVARLAQVATRSIYRWVEASELHFREEPDGLLSICVESLMRKVEKAGSDNSSSVEAVTRGLQQVLLSTKDPEVRKTK